MLIPDEHWMKYYISLCWLEPNNSKIHDFLTLHGHELVARIKHFFGNFFELIYRRVRD